MSDTTPAVRKAAPAGRSGIPVLTKTKIPSASPTASTPNSASTASSAAASPTATPRSTHAASNSHAPLHIAPLKTGSSGLKKPTVSATPKGTSTASSAAAGKKPPVRAAQTPTATTSNGAPAPKSSPASARSLHTPSPASASAVLPRPSPRTTGTGLVTPRTAAGGTAAHAKPTATPRTAAASNHSATAGTPKAASLHAKPKPTVGGAAAAATRVPPRVSGIKPPTGAKAPATPSKTPAKAANGTKAGSAKTTPAKGAKPATATTDAAAAAEPAAVDLTADDDTVDEHTLATIAAIDDSALDAGAVNIVGNDEEADDDGDFLMDSTEFEDVTDLTRQPSDSATALLDMDHLLSPSVEDDLDLGLDSPVHSRAATKTTHDIDLTQLSPEPVNISIQPASKPNSRSVSAAHSRSTSTPASPKAAADAADTPLDTSNDFAMNTTEDEIQAIFDDNSLPLPDSRAASPQVRDVPSPATVPTTSAQQPTANSNATVPAPVPVSVKSVFEASRDAAVRDAAATDSASATSATVTPADELTQSHNVTEALESPPSEEGAPTVNRVVSDLTADEIAESTAISNVPVTSPVAVHRRTGSKPELQAADSIPRTKDALVERIRAMEIARREAEEVKKQQYERDMAERRKKAEEEMKKAEEERLVREAVESRAAEAAAQRAREEESARAAAEAKKQAEGESKRRRLEEVNFLLQNGITVTKIPRNGAVRDVTITVQAPAGMSTLSDATNSKLSGEWYIHWSSKKKSDEESRMLLNECDIILGTQDGLFRKKKWRKQFHEQHQLCLTVLSTSRSLDLVCHTDTDFNALVNLLRRLPVLRIVEAPTTAPDID